MPRFRVQIRGENFLLDLDGEHAKFCLQATRIVKAATQQEAEKIALIKMHQEVNRSSHLIKDIPDAPKIYLEQIEALRFYQFSRGKKYRGINFIKEETHPD